ncbi:MAG: hypothetical protein PGN34_00210 [Methylobacterium frigidaeris]
MRGATVLRLALAALLAAGAARADDAPEPDAPWPPEATAGEVAGPVTLQLGQGFSLDLPAGWELEDAEDDPGDATGRMRVRIVCRTPACRRTQETCTMVLRRAPVPGTDDAARLAGLRAAPLSRYFRLRAVLKSTSAGATVRRPLGPERFGPRDWIAVETEAAPGFKSGLFAETVIGGRYLGAICRTCETGEVRHDSARALLGSVRREEQSAAR